nr:hypothetical protein [Tanacetum cinerariifolium]
MKKTILLYFVEKGDDTFYVTIYDNDGLECGGYNVVRKHPGRIVTHVWPYQDYPQMLPTDFLFGLDQNALLSIIGNRINHDVHVQRVEIGEQTGVFKYQLNEDDWNALVEATMTDERMEHICLWPGHTEHFSERNDTFYKRFSSTLDKQRLMLIVMPFHNIEFGDSDNPPLEVYIESRFPVKREPIELLTFPPPVGNSSKGVLVIAYRLL